MTFADMIVWQVLFHHRRVWELEEAQARVEWLGQYAPAPWDRKLGIIGDAAEEAAALLRPLAFEPRLLQSNAKPDGSIELLLVLDGRGDPLPWIAPGGALIMVEPVADALAARVVLALESGALSAASLSVHGGEKHPRLLPIAGLSKAA